MTESLVDKIKHRIFEILIFSDGSIRREKAMRLAAKQVARVEKIKANALPRLSPNTDTPNAGRAEGSAKREFFGRILALHERLTGAGRSALASPPPRQTPAPLVPRPSTPQSPSVGLGSQFAQLRPSGQHNRFKERHLVIQQSQKDLPKISTEGARV